MAIWKLENWGIGACGLAGGAACPCGARYAPPPGDEVWACCSLTAACHPVANTHLTRGKGGCGVLASAALPRWGKGRCRCACSTLFAPAGQKRFRVGAPDFGRFTGKSFLRGVLPIRKLSRRAGERETEPSYISQRGEMYAVSRAERALLPVKSSTSSYRRKRGTLQDAPHHPRVSRRMRAGVQDYLPALPAAPPSPDHPAGRSAGSARTRSRVQTLENPFLGDGNRFPRGSRLPTAAGRRPLLVGRLPCMRFAAGTETKRSTQAPYSWGLGA